MKYSYIFLTKASSVMEPKLFCVIDKFKKLEFSVPFKHMLRSSTPNR